MPDNGLCVFVGTVLNEEGKEKKISFALEPFKPINTYVLCPLCGVKVDVLRERRTGKRRNKGALKDPRAGVLLSSPSDRRNLSTRVYGEARRAQAAGLWLLRKLKMKGKAWRQGAGKGLANGRQNLAEMIVGMLQLTTQITVHV